MTRYLTGTYPGGYRVAYAGESLDIESSASIGGVGLYAEYGVTVNNDGKIEATRNSGITIGDHNFNIIANGADNHSAVIEGSESGISYGSKETGFAFTRVMNYGTIVGHGTSRGSAGIYFGDGGGNLGVITNGSSTDIRALIEGYCGIGDTWATISNFGSVVGATFGVAIYPSGGSPVLTNGSQSDHTARIRGAKGGVYLPLTIATLTNWGTISTGGRDAVYMGGLIDNFGTITSTGASGCGVTLNFYNSTVVNGSAHYTTASIVGVAYGFVTNKYGPATTIVNYGTIRATGAAGYGVALTNIYWPVGGYVRNGSAMDTSALMAGSKGGELIESEEVKFVNYGTVAGGSAGGVRLEGAYDVLLNGSATDTSALIGGTGPSLVSGVSDTVVNFGTIAGLSLTSTNDVLRVEAGCAFESPVTVAGTLSLATGVGTLSDLIGGQVVVSGSMAPASFNGFGTLVIDKGAAFAVAGTGMIASNQTLLDEGVLTVTGSLIVAGTAMGVGSIGIGADADATFDGALPASLTVAFRGTGSTLSLQDPAAFAATIANFALRGTIDLVGVTATGATLEAGDRLAIVDGTTPVATLQLAGAFGADTFTATSDGHGGTLIGVNRVASPLALISAAASLGVGPGGAGAPLAPRPSYSRLGLAAPHVQMA